MALHIERLTLYKHGLGFFERGGEAEASFVLEFPRRAMDDILKSLTVLPKTATVSGVAFETPADRNPEAQRRPLDIDADRPLSSVIDAFAGRRISVSVGDRSVEGELVGLEREEDEHLERALLAVNTVTGIRLLALRDVTKIALLDDSAQGDLSFALENKRRDEERSYARVTLSSASEVQVNYIAPAPAWRVSYRVLAAPIEGEANSEARDVFVQGWGIFDNTLEEDLEDVQLTLTAGMPVSFRYGLHQPTTPNRPFVQDDSRVISAPMEFAAMGGGDYDHMDMMMAEPAGAMEMAAAPAPMMKRSRMQMTAASVGESAPIQASGDARGALFAYRIDAPVTVRRGESGMVPILSVKACGERELLFNARKNANHPASSVRFRNGTLTLERGPATVIDNGEYAGEAIVPFTTAGTEVILAFAVELGVSVSSQAISREETRSVVVRDGSLFVGVVEYIETTYTVVSQLAQPCVVTLEHPRQYNAELETKAIESTVSEARFKCPVGSRATVESKIVEKRDRSRFESVRGIDGDRLQEFLNEKLLDRTLYDALSEVLTLQARVFTLEQSTEQRENEREKVRERMNDTRANLSSLDATQDSSLRERFVKQLETLEDRMVAFDTEDSDVAREVERLEHDIANELLRLSNG
jgi:hypothetical protein